jgi:hypothetical protein
MKLPVMICISVFKKKIMTIIVIPVVVATSIWCKKCFQLVSLLHRLVIFHLGSMAYPSFGGRLLGEVRSFHNCQVCSHLAQTWQPDGRYPKWYACSILGQPG